VGSGVVFQGTEAEPQDQDICGHERQCCEDTNLDSTDCNVDTAISSAEVQIQLVLI
jgi:hypothetical protein